MFQIVLLIAVLLISVNFFLFFYYSRSPERALFIKPVPEFDTDKKIIALTFDDGPSGATTPAVLDVLKKNEVKATFFLVGKNMEKYPDVTERIIREGHEVGHHTYNHTRMIFRTPGFIKDDLNRMDKIFIRFTGGKIHIYRPPFGTKMIALPFVLKREKKKLITWSVEPKCQYDRENFSGKKIAEYVTANIEPGAIILLHDGWSGIKSELTPALETIIQISHDKGYEFVTITEGMSQDF